jgi:hypothetical protein
VGWGGAGASDRFADARAYLGARPWGRRRDDGWVDPQGATPAARSFVGRRLGAGAGAGRKGEDHRGVDGLGAGDWVGLHRSVGDRCERGGSPSSRRVWKQRRASLRAMVSETRVWDSSVWFFPSACVNASHSPRGFRQSTLARERLSPGNDDRIDLRSELADVSSVPEGFYRVRASALSAQIGQGHSSRKSSNV